MRHAILTCKNHPELRWSCKVEACNPNGAPGSPAMYNGCRNIFFNGVSTGKMYHDNSGLQCTTFLDGVHYFECACPSSDLVIAPEDPFVTR